jgi:hypothetical protein
MPFETRGRAPGVYVLDEPPLSRAFESEPISNLAMITQVTWPAVANPDYSREKSIREISSWDEFLRVLGGNCLILSAIFPGARLDWSPAGPLPAAGLPPAAAQPPKVLAPIGQNGPFKLLARQFKALKASVAKSQGLLTAARTNVLPGVVVQASTLAAAPAVVANAPTTQAEFASGLQDVASIIKAIRKENEAALSQPAAGSTLADAKTWLEGAFSNLADACDNDNTLPVAQKDLILASLGPLAVTAWSVFGYFKNGGRRLILVDVKWDDVSDLVKGLKSITLDTLAHPSIDAGLVCAPGRTESEIQNALKEYCARRDGSHDNGEPFCFAVLDSENKAEPSSPGDRNTVDAYSAASFWPWLVVGETEEQKPIVVPPAGFVAGIIAGTDAGEGPHRAPAGIDKVVRGAMALTQEVNEARAGKLNTGGINCLRHFPNADPVVFGARTLSENINYRYVPVVRLLMMIRKTIKRQIKWAVFKPNTSSLRKSITRDLYAYLEGLRRKGQLAGDAAGQAFRVVCDDSNNSRDEQREGRLNIRVEVAPVRPAEFIVVEVTELLQPAK